MLQLIKQKANELTCYVLGSHVPEARMRFTKAGYMEGYWICSRCGKELSNDD